jgi:pimeloyl-ACP methyl ester carboxylesterase
MATMALPDLEVYYEQHGTAGPRLLVFNGSGGTIQAITPLVDQLARHFQVLVHDQRGLGRTGPPTAPATMAHYAADAIALLDHVGWDTARVFGISFGGMAAQEFAVTVPDRVERLALLCTSSGGAGGASFPLHTLASLPLEERVRVSVRNLDTRFDDEWLAGHPGDQQIVRMSAERAAAPRTDEQLRGERMQLQARADFDVWDRLPAITCPTLVACGQFDGVAPPANSQAIVSRIAGSQLRQYEGGHMFVYQDRTALPEIIEFLAA